MGRAPHGKQLHSEIFLKRGVIADLAQYAQRILPAKSHGAAKYVVTDANLSTLLADDIVAGIRAAGISCEKVHNHPFPSSTSH